MIATSEELASTVAALRRDGIAALDTEFVWERTYYPDLGVVQMGSSGAEAWAWDALAPEVPSPMAELLEDRETVKILHDARQDLSILLRYTGATPWSVFDTRIAAGFAGFPSTLSLQQLLQQTLGVGLSKTETRTNWCRRPLSEAQLAYALDDVRHLAELREFLIQSARKQGTEAWLTEEMARFDDPTLYAERDPEEAWQRVKGSGRLSSRSRMLLRVLAAFREEQAMVQNKPRNWVLQDELLISLASDPPGGMKDLASYKGFPRQAPKEFSQELYAAIERACSMPPPEASATPRRSSETVIRKRTDEVLAILKQRAQELHIDPALFGSRSQISLWIEHPDSPGHPLLQGWRFEAAGQDLLGASLGVGACRAESSLPFG